MNHPIPRDWLAATNKIEAEFRNGAEEAKQGHGSGFWIDSGAEMVLVTNRHMVDIVYKDEKYRGLGLELSSLTIRTFKADGARGSLFVNGGTIETHEDPRIDIALLRGLRLVRQEIPVSPMGFDLLADTGFTETELEWGAQITFSSFQAWRDAETDRPILRTGIVSSDPAHAFSLGAGIARSRVHLVEALSFAGSSGSPVFANAWGLEMDDTLAGGPGLRPAKIIGVMTGHLRVDADVGAAYQTHTGLSFCHRSDLLRGMLLGTEPLRRTQFIASHVPGT